MAKSKSTRSRRTVRPTLVEVHGHKLTIAQKLEYDGELAQRRHRKPTEAWGESKDFALGNVLYRARPSVQAHKSLESMALYERLSKALTALGAMGQYPLWMSDQRVVTIGHELMGHVADELGAVERELRSMHAAISQEVANG